MDKVGIDCLFIGYKEAPFEKHVKMLKAMGQKSGAYRDLSLDYINHDGKPYTAPGIFNSLFYGESPVEDGMGPLGFGNVFSLTIAYLGTYLHKRGYTFDYVNSFQDQNDELIKKLKSNILTIAIPTTLYVSVHPILEIVDLIKKHNKSAKIIIGGPFIAGQIRSLDEMSVQYMLSAIKADFYVYNSQGENALVKIISSLKEGSSFEEIENIYYLNGGKYVFTGDFPENNPLDENTVDWDLFAEKLGHTAAVRTAISCPFSCSYCEYPQHAGKYQTMSFEYIEKELNQLANIKGVKYINFIDDTFNVPPDRFKEILRMMIRNKYGFKWNSFFRCQFADDEMIELMKESGCEGVYLGIESGSPEILKNMNKAATVLKYEKGIELLKKQGIITVASFLIGFPGETYETFSETLRFIEANQPDFITLHLWYCSKITPIWGEREKYDIKGSQFEWSHTGMNTSTACDLISELHSSVKNSVYIPQYNFDFLGVLGMMHRGLSLEQAKDFLRIFNEEVRNKLKSNDQYEMSIDAVKKLKMICDSRTC